MSLCAFVLFVLLWLFIYGNHLIKKSLYSILSSLKSQPPHTKMFLNLILFNVSPLGSSVQCPVSSTNSLINYTELWRCVSTRICEFNCSTVHKRRNESHDGWMCVLGELWNDVWWLLMKRDLAGMLWIWSSIYFNWRKKNNDRKMWVHVKAVHKHKDCSGSRPHDWFGFSILKTTGKETEQG